MINARAESVPSKPAFRRAFAARRCLIPADGWYEWQRSEHGKQAFYMNPSDGTALAFAGLYEFWSPKSDDPAAPTLPTLTTTTIITTAAVGALAEIHDRMPLVLDRRDWHRWLDPDVSDPTDLLEAWDEAAGAHIELRPVSSQVNSVTNNNASLIEPVQPIVPEPAQQLF
jgi:putative SOS response-associated peptidase YedK